MTEKMEKFTAEYLIDFNATQAAIRAGYSEKTAYSIGQENLKKPEIQKIIEQEKKMLLENTENIIFENLAYWKSLVSDRAVKHAEKLKASEYLGRYASMFNERETDKQPIILRISESDAKL